jgi:hypothetical protein
VATSTKSKALLHKGWQAALADAYDRGLAAAAALTPRPMVVGTPKNLMGSLLGGDDGGFDPNEPIYFESEGVCGFAWVTVRGSTPFQNWLKGRVKTEYPASAALRHVEGRHFRDTSAVNPPDRGYHGGTSVWVGGFGQSMQRKEAFAEAFADRLSEVEGVTAYAGSRMD